MYNECWRNSDLTINTLLLPILRLLITMLKTDDGAIYGGANDLRPGTWAGFLSDEPDGSFLMAGRSVRAQKRRSSPAAPRSRSWDPVGEERP